jgi:hypothetical protein
MSKKVIKLKSQKNQTRNFNSTTSRQTLSDYAHVDTQPENHFNLQHPKLSFSAHPHCKWRSSFSSSNILITVQKVLLTYLQATLPQLCNWGRYWGIISRQRRFIELRRHTTDLGFRIGCKGRAPRARSTWPWNTSSLSLKLSLFSWLKTEFSDSLNYHGEQEAPKKQRQTNRRHPKSSARPTGGTQKAAPDQQEAPKKQRQTSSKCGVHHLICCNESTVYVQSADYELKTRTYAIVTNGWSSLQNF